MKRPKAEIVAGWEASHPEFFEGLVPECVSDCRCHRCFLKALDSLVAKSEAIANDSGIGVGEHNDLASYLVSQCSGANGLDSVQHFNGR